MIHTPNTYGANKYAPQDAARLLGPATSSTLHLIANRIEDKTDINRVLVERLRLLAADLDKAAGDKAAAAPPAEPRVTLDELATPARRPYVKPAITFVFGATGQGITPREFSDFVVELLDQVGEVSNG